jgi:hypothetical protein
MKTQDMKTIKESQRDKRDNSAPHSEEETLISFLQETKNGKYARIEKSSLSYVRIKETTFITEGQYYYSIR